MSSRFTPFIDEVQERLMLLGESVLDHLPQALVPPEKFRDLHVVCHRGARTTGRDAILENTLPAFDRAVELGAWGIEFDVRFTACGEPIVHHDAHTERVFQKRLVIDETPLSRLRVDLAAVPTLEEIVARYRGRAHFMIELKTMLTSPHRAALQTQLKGLEPGRDYHFMSLKSARLKQIQFVPPEALLPIAEFNAPWLSREALREGWAGLTGQYFLIGQKTITKHQLARQKVGTGFVNTVAALTREVARGVDWVFTDRPQAILEYSKRRLEKSTERNGA